MTFQVYDCDAHVPPAAEDISSKVVLLKIEPELYVVRHDPHMLVSKVPYEDVRFSSMPNQSGEVIRLRPSDLADLKGLAEA